MGTSQCEGLVCIRERVVFHSLSSVHKLNKNVKEASFSSFDGHFGRLSDNVWYFCISRASSATLEWFTVDAGTESSEEEDIWSPSTNSGLGGATLVATTNVSSVKAVDGEHVKLPEAFGSLPLGSHERNQLESCSFYVEDKVLRVVLLIETETQTQRDEWVQFLGTLLSKMEDKLEQEVDTQEAGDDVVEDLELLPAPTLSISSPSSSISARSMLHQGKSKNLMEEGDPFGLLSLKTSALGSFKTTTTNPAPGMFAMDHFGLTEGTGQEDDIEDANDSDASVANTDLDCAADTAVDPSSWLVSRQRQSRERSCSHATYSHSSNVVRQPYTGIKSRRNSMGAAFGSSFSSMGECLRCSKRFGRLIHTPKMCASCLYHFCRDHCNQRTVLTTPETITLPTQEMMRSQEVARAAASASELRRVCMDCFVRQQLLISLQEAGVYYASVVDEAGGLSRLVRWKYFGQGPKLEIEAHIRARSLGPLSLLSAMFKYQQQPFMFVVVLAQLVQNVENCLETMDFYWPQFLHWGFVNLSNASPSVRVFYLFFLAATARRSVNLALKATWECIAAHWDAMAGGRYKRGNGIVVMLFFVTNINFGEPRSVLSQLLFPQAPKHQRESFDKLLKQLYEYVRRVYAISQRESPFFEWLLARSKEEVVVSSRNVRKQLRACDGVLDPFPTNYHEETQLLILERRQSGTQHLVETKQRMWNKPAQHIFSDEVRLVRFLVDLCTYLKENIPEPSQRKKKLPTLLQEMLRGKHIRPEAALPLSGAVAHSHRVVNVLINEECDGDSCELDGRANHDSNLDALVGVAVDMTNEMEGVLEPHQQEIINYLDGEFVQTYVAGLIPVSRTAPQASFRSSISEDQGDLDHVVPTGCTPLSETADDDRFSGDEIDEVADDELNGNDGTNKSESSSSTSSSAAFKCPFFGERFADTQRRIREDSTFSHYDGWALVPVIAKSFDDMRQEVFVLQGLKLFQLIFRKHNLDLWMRYYSIVCAGKDCGLLEVITDAQSLDGLKKKGTNINGIGTSLPKIFERACGRDPITGDYDPVRLELARANFITSMAAYSLFCYIFLVKDRHNGNIMLSTEGHVVHIDFGFVLGIAPGNTFSLETAPFKLTPEMVEIMGAEGFDRYRQLVAQGLFALHLEASQLLSLVYLSSKDSCFPCFKGQSRARIVRRLSHRLCTGWSEHDVKRTAARIVDKSNGHRGTRQYDWFQKISNGIMP